MSFLRCDAAENWPDDEPPCEACGGLGEFVCDCGGDICVCDNNGSEPCAECQF